jgi:hypothetical protein
MRNVTRTVYGAAMQTAMYIGKSYQVQENSTLNEKFGIQANTLPSAEERHAVRYFCIGNGGHRAIVGAEGLSYTTPNHHEATDAACFNHLPFVLREVTDDLTQEQRAKYGLRREEQHNGRQYFAYYGKRLTLDAVEVNMQKTIVDGNNQTSEPFVPTSSNLNPEPLAGTDQETNVIEASGEYVSGSAVVTIDFTAADAEELRNVALIVYGDEKYAVISEMALVGGVDRVVTGPGPGNNTINYNEVISAQVTTFIASYYQLDMQNNGFTFTADVGVTEPLYAISE